MARVAAVFVSLAALVSASASAGDHCDRCGGCCNLRKVCRPEPSFREVVKVCWDVKCEDFCVPKCGHKCGVARGCDECGAWCADIWKSNCAQVRTRRVPVKTEVVRKIPTTKWVVETLCADCCSCRAAQQDSGPPPQLVAADAMDVRPIDAPIAPVSFAEPAETAASAAPVGRATEPRAATMADRIQSAISGLLAK